MYKWNPTIEEAQKYLFKAEEALRTTNKRVGKVKGKETEIKTKEVSVRDKDIRTFVKVFLAKNDVEVLQKLVIKNLSRIINLSYTGMKVLFYLFTIINKDDDFVKFSNKRCMEALNLSYNSVRIGIRELLKKDFIYESYNDGEYWIDCTFFYIGDFEKKSKELLNAKK